MTESNLGGWSEEKPHLDAVCGGVTSMVSLLTGIERASVAPGEPGADVVPLPLSSTAAVLGNYDRKAEEHVARLRKVKEISERSRFAGGMTGHRLGSDGGGTSGCEQPPVVSNASGLGNHSPALRHTATPPAAPVPSSRAPRPCSTLATSSAASTTAPRRPAVGAKAASGAAARQRHRMQPPTPQVLRDMAATAAEARAAAAQGSGTVPPTSVSATPSTPSTCGAPSTLSSVRSERSVVDVRSLRASGTRPAAALVTARSAACTSRGAAKAAVAAVRRERAAEAAERRLGLIDIE